MSHSYTLLFATNNQNKVKEIMEAVDKKFIIKSLKDIQLDIEIEEPHETLMENASEKSHTIFNITGQNCFSEDTGLEVDALMGAPGVRSARYAGEPANDQNNIEKLLSQMQDKSNRNARFRTVISLIWQDKEYWFEGICEGEILFEKKGDAGFGYDPIFMPNGSQLSFAQMTMSQKGQFSHRKKAMQKLIDFLNQSV